MHKVAHHHSPFRDHKRDVILIADHDVSRRITIERWLVPCGFIVRMIVQGDSLAAAIEHYLPDVVLLSPRFQDRDVCETLRTIEAVMTGSGTGVIVLGDQQTYEQRLRVLDAGAFAVLRSPAAVEEISALLRAYQRLKAHLSNAVRMQSVGTSDSAAFLDEFHSILEACFHDPDLTLHNFAGRAPWSADYISRRILVLSGLPFRRYVLRYRLSMARERLEHAECSVAEVARQCGFNHASYFSNVFRREFGMLPKKLQMSVQRNRRLRQVYAHREALSSHD